MEYYYPVTLNLREKKVVIVGGGRVAERRISGLLPAQADITVVSPEVTEKIRQLADSGQVLWSEKPFRKEDIAGAFMIFAATNNPKLNKEIKDAAAANQLVTIADDHVGSDFHVPAQIQRGRLTIAVSTGGASPTLARKIRQQLEQEFGERYEEFLEFLYSARQQILDFTDDPVLKSELLGRIAGPTFLNSENREADLNRLYEEIKRLKSNRRL